MINRRLLIAALVMAAGVLSACHSSLVPMRPIQRIETWVPDEVATTASQPSTQLASTEPATEPTTPTTRPGHKVVKVIDPNQTTRFIYKASYDNIWQQAMDILVKDGFTLDRQDFRLGILTTRPIPSAQIMEVWKPQFTTANNAFENTFNSQDRTVRVTISPVPDKPEFFAIAVQVAVERETNPSEQIAGPIFAEGSGFGRNQLILQSDYEPIEIERARWIIIGRDVDLEKKILDQLFNRI